MRRITFELWLRNDRKALENKEICKSGQFTRLFR